MAESANDQRPESYKVEPSSIRIIESGKGKDPVTRTALWLPYVVDSLTALKQEQEETGKSLGIVRPEPDSIKFTWEVMSDVEDEDKALAKNSYKQASLFNSDALKPLPAPEYSFKYHFTSGAAQHSMTIHDWEVQATYQEYKRLYGDVGTALEKMREYYEEQAPAMNLHLIMGNMQKRPGQFIIIGVLRTSADIDAIGANRSLF